MNRRSLMGAFLAFAALPLSKLKAAPLPVLYCDGFHDDSVALQAFFDDKEIIQGERVMKRSRGDELIGLRMWLERPITVSLPNWPMHQCHVYGLKTLS